MKHSLAECLLLQDLLVIFLISPSLYIVHVSKFFLLFNLATLMSKGILCYHLSELSLNFSDFEETRPRPVQNCVAVSKFYLSARGVAWRLLRRYHSSFDDVQKVISSKNSLDWSKIA